MTLPRFYPIFDSADWIARMLPLGVKLVQLRIKDRPSCAPRSAARAICAAPPGPFWW
jgi:thiamine-phosphate pyrophosphorylase